ncbi:AtpZ/AtpI family protein [Lachnospiraceae bacterium 62-35]
MKEAAGIMKSITLLGQIGLSLMAPLLLCLLLCTWLCSHFSLGVWVYIPGFFFGLGGSGMTAYKLYHSIMAHEKKKKRTPAAFNDHT